MINHICIISQRYPCEATPTVHVFVQKIAWAMCDYGVKVSVISPVPSNSKNHKNTPISYTETTSKGNHISVYRPRYLYLGSKKRAGFSMARLSESFFIKACDKAIQTMEEIPDVFYGHFVVMAGLCACELGKKYEKKCFIAYGESTDESIKEFGMERIRKKIQNVNGIIAVSTKNKNNLIENGIVLENKIGVFVNGVNTNLFYPRNKKTAREKYGLKDTDFVTAFVGQFTERKGVNIVEAALREINDVKALFAGKGPLIPTGKYVKFSGALPQQEIPWLLSAADVFVFPSQHEGCSNAILEAMACGLPVIAADLDFNYDILDSSNSILVDGKDAQQVRMAILQLKDDPMRMSSMSKATLEKIKDLSIEQRAENILKWIEKK